MKNWSPKCAFIRNKCILEYLINCFLVDVVKGHVADSFWAILCLFNQLTGQLDLNIPWRCFQSLPLCSLLPKSMLECANTYSTFDINDGERKWHKKQNYCSVPLQDTTWTNTVAVPLRLWLYDQLLYMSMQNASTLWHFPFVQFGQKTFICVYIHSVIFQGWIVLILSTFGILYITI